MDLHIKHGDVPMSFLYVYQRVNPMENLMENHHFPRGFSYGFWRLWVAAGWCVAPAACRAECLGCGAVSRRRHLRSGTSQSWIGPFTGIVPRFGRVEIGNLWKSRDWSSRTIFQTSMMKRKTIGKWSRWEWNMHYTRRAHVSCVFLFRFVGSTKVVVQGEPRF